MQFVYILRCSDNSCYTGCTENIEARLKRHASGYVEYTKTRLPVDLIFHCGFNNKEKAFEFEKYLKVWFGDGV